MNGNEVGASEMMANFSIGSMLFVIAVMTGIRLLLVAAARAARPMKTGGVPLARQAADLVEALMLAAVIVFMIIRPFLLQAYYIPSSSMEPTLLGHTAGIDEVTALAYDETIHDNIFVDKLAYRFREPSRGDIIVFNAPPAAEAGNSDEPDTKRQTILIKRLIGLPGDTIEIHDGAVWLKKPSEREFTPLEEPYINEPMDDPQPDEAIFGTNGPMTLAPGQYFVMGDNRNHSSDGRFWGPISRGSIIGKAWLIFIPINRCRLLQ